MPISETMLRQMMPNAGARLTPHLPYINPAMDEGHVTTSQRIAAFLSQLSHESKEYLYMEEIADGSAYEGRTDLGNIYPGDGVKFKGHGPIQITGRRNHERCGIALGLNLIDNPRLICLPENGTRSAVWFWNEHKLSLLADRGWFRTITKIINGGYNGMADRIQYWNRNRRILNLPPIDISQERQSIMAFQASVGLQADGVIGPRTMAALGR